MIGGGFIGSEIAAALRMNGCEVTLLVQEPGIGARLFPAGLSDFVTGYYRDKGVEVLAGETVASIEGTRVTTGGGRVLEADCVVAGLGIEPAAELAADAGLAVDDGILVDELGRCGGREDVFAAGDVARFPATKLGVTMRVEHEDNANSHGRAVGANMAGAGAPYDHLPFFYSDLFELGYEAVGEVYSQHETRGRMGDAEPQGRRLLRRRRRPPSRLPALGRLGQGRRRHRPDRGGRAGHARDAARPAGLSRAAIRVNSGLAVARGRAMLGQARLGQLRRPGRR